MYTLDDLVILSVLQFSDVHVDSSPIEVHARRYCVPLPPHAFECGSSLGRAGSGVVALDGLASTLGDPLERRVSFMLTTMLVAAVGGNRTLLQRFLGGWAVALAFRRETFASLGVFHTAAAGFIRRASPCHKTRSSVADDLEGRTL